jgi:hypothetical protein
MLFLFCISVARLYDDSALIISSHVFVTGGLLLCNGSHWFMDGLTGLRG